MGGFQFTSGGKSFSFGGGSPDASKPHHRHGIGGFVANLGSDVKDAVVGLPTGLVETVKHPIRSGKTMARATWQDWKPLAEGHPIAFAKQTYDHPLAPLLDVATVFSAGAGISAKLGEAAVTAGSTSRLAHGAAALGRSGSRQVADARAVTEGRVPRPSLTKTHSASAGRNLRRELANRALLHLEPHLPAWFKQTEREGRLYDRLHGSDIAHRGAATNLQINAIMQAGKTIADPALQHIIQPELLSHNYWNLRRYAHKHNVGDPLPVGYRYVRELTNPSAQFAAKPGVELESRMRSFGKDYTTSDAKKAATVGKHHLIVPKANADALGQEGERSTRFLRTMAHKPVTLWKRVNVGYAPRVITNNAVGNWAMHAMRTGGDSGGKGFIDAIRYAHGNRRAMSAFKEMRDHIHQTQGDAAAAKFTALAHPAIVADPSIAGVEAAFGKHAAEAVKRKPDWLRQNFSDELGNVFGTVLDDGKGSRSKLSKAAKQGLYPIVNRVADEPVRVAALYQFMRRSPEIKAYLKTHPGVKLDHAIQDVLKRNPGKLRERAVEHTRSIAGDYTAMSPAEKLIQNIVPFYLWDKHIVKHFANMVGEKPGRVVAMQQVSRMGADETKKLLGAVPGFLDGALPLALFGMHKHGDRTPVLGTQGLNPYSTIGELADTATALTFRHDSQSGSEAASQLSPILTGLIEQFSGHKIGSNAPAETHGGVIPSVLADTALGTSYGTLAQRLINGTPKPKVDSHGKSKPFLYQKTPQEVVAGLLGLPVKNVDLDRAAQMAAQDMQDGKKKKKHGFQLGR